MNLRSFTNPTSFRTSFLLALTFMFVSSSIKSTSAQSPRIPQNESPPSFSLPDDGCGDYMVRFKEDKKCYPVLKKGPCPSLKFWVTIDPKTLEGICTPRLCGKDRVFVGRDGLCHDINDPRECSGGRRLYYSAFGDPICDCPVGQYPFPTDKDSCVPLFTQGPCPTNQVVAVGSSGKLECVSDTCQATERFMDGFLLQWVPTMGDDDDNGFCFALGTKGPCSSSELYGFNIHSNEGQCVDMKDPKTPYFSSPEENALLDEIYNNPSSNFRTTLNDTQLLPLESIIRTRATRGRRQGFNTVGIFQQPSQIPTSLLNPCQTGGRFGNNFKCTNPLVPNKPRREVMKPGSSAFSCPGSSVLQANGSCGNRGPQASCGPSYQYVASTNQCRPIRF